MDNKKVRTFKTKYTQPKKNVVELFYSIDEIKQQQKQKQFKVWLNTEYPSTYKIDIVNNMIEDIFTVLKNNKYDINNPKQFKDEIASHIYYNSTR
tara:strand:- start:418 stop:702 length:285 start_codon:yes stop_codon:yes gene_type:complete